MASVDINIVGAIAPFTYSVKDEYNVERFTSYNNGKIYFNAITDGNNHEYVVTVSKDNIVVTNTILLYGCSNTPIPVPIPDCSSPTITFISKTDKTVNLYIDDTGVCDTYQFQYSSSIDFLTFNSFSVQSCVATQSLTFPNYGTIYIRLKKTCLSTTVFSNSISVNLTSVPTPAPIPVPVNSCLSNCDSYYIYSDVAWGVEYLDCEGTYQTYSGNGGGTYMLCACSGTISDLYGSPLITLNTVGGCNTTPTPVPVPIPVPVTVCKTITFTVSLQDLQNADGGILFGQFRNCSNVLQSVTFSSPGVFNYCSFNTIVGASLYMYVAGNQVIPSASGYTLTTTNC